MKRLVLALVVLTVALLTSYAMAGGGNTSFELQKAWNAEQAQQDKISAELSRIDRDAARAFSKAPVPIKQRAAGGQSSTNGPFCVCSR
jgi:hypothetical protein